MTTVRITFVLVMMLYLFGLHSQRTAYSVLEGEQCGEDKGNNQLYVLLFLLLAGVAGLRQGFVDTNSYRKIFEVVGRDYDIVINGNLRIEKGFRFICYVLNWITNDSQILLIVTSLFITYAIFKFIDKYSTNRWMSAVIFFLSLYLTTMNTMRQYIVVGVLLLATPLLTKRKWFLFLIISMALTTIHSTAFLAGIAIVLCRGKYMNMRVIALAVVSIILAATPADRFLVYLQNVNLQDYADMYVSLGKSGVNMLRLAVQTVPVVMGLIYIHLYGRDSMDEDYQMFANLSVLNLMVYILSTRSNYLARIAIYFELFNVVLIPFFLSRIIKQDQVRIVNGIAVMLYSVYFYYIIIGFGSSSVDMLTPFFIGG